MGLRDAQKIGAMTLEQIADYMVDKRGIRDLQKVGQSELQFRVAQFQERTTLASERAATAAEKYTRWMFWSVTVLAISMVAQVIVALARWNSPGP